MVRRIAVFLFVVACFPFAGCSRNREVTDFVGELDSFTTQLVAKVNSSNGSAAGVEEAQKYFDSKRDVVRKKYDAIKSVRGFQIDADTKQKLIDSVSKNITLVEGLKITYAGNTVGDKAFAQKLDKLTSAYEDLLRA